MRDANDSATRSFPILVQQPFFRVLLLVTLDRFNRRIATAALPIFDGALPDVSEPSNRMCTFVTDDIFPIQVCHIG
jgi:hypothetical protein